MGAESTITGKINAHTFPLIVTVYIHIYYTHIYIYIIIIFCCILVYSLCPLENNKEPEKVVHICIPINVEAAKAGSEVSSQPVLHGEI